jgi:hypothetical protein
MGTSGATIRYASDDTSILADSVALSNAHARSAFYLRNCVNVKISDLTFVGGDKTNLTTDNVGNAVSARYSIGTTVERCTARGGYAIFAEDATTDLAGTGDSLTNASGTVTVTDTAGACGSGQVHQRERRHGNQFVHVVDRLRRSWRAHPELPQREHPRPHRTDQ